MRTSEETNEWHQTEKKRRKKKTEQIQYLIFKKLLRNKSWLWVKRKMMEKRKSNMRSSKGIRFLLLLVCAFVVANFLFLVYPSNKRTSLSGLELDPNAPVVLVADDEAKPHQATGEPPESTSKASPPLRLRLKPGSLAKNFLVFSYDHGGGGLLTDAVFNIYQDDVFFLYQPLYKLVKEHQEPPPRILDDKQGVAGVGWLQHVYNCSLTRHSDLLHEPYLWKSRAVLATYTTYCQASNGGGGVGMAGCVARACRQRGLRGAFTVRLPPSHLIHLIHHYANTLKGAELCTAMAQMVDQAHLLHSQYPGSIKVVHYEHLVLEPHRVLSHIYNFLGFEVSNEHLSSVMKTLKLNHPEELRLQMTKMWQVELTLQESRAVDRGCMQYYPMLGYLPVPRRLIYTSTLFQPWDDTQF